MSYRVSRSHAISLALSRVRWAGLMPVHIASVVAVRGVVTPIASDHDAAYVSGWVPYPPGAVIFFDDGCCSCLLNHMKVDVPVSATCENGEEETNDEGENDV